MDSGSSDAPTTTKTVGARAPTEVLLQALAAAPPIPVKIDRLSPGTQVGGFQINGVLGAGSMGVVYEAIDLALDRRVALKLHARRGQDVRTSRMWREAKAMARLTHPNVIAVYEVGEHEGRVFIAMELVEGGTVRDWLAEGEPGTIRSWQSILDVFLQAAEGLAAAHAVDLVHRDFKPDNILVGGDGRARVADFGLARGATGGSDSGGAESEDPVSAPDVDMRVTQTGMTVGTPAYMAPEQLTRGEVDHRCDQFSFCVALFEALHGVRPYDAQTLTGLLEQVSGGDIRTPDTDRIVPAWLLSVVRRGLGARPEDRFPSMRQLIIALRDDPSRRRGRIWLGAGVLAALGLTAWVTRAASSVEEPCQGLGDEVRAIWNPSVADRVERALRATGSKVADDASGRVRSTLDDYAGRWGTLRAEACLATRVRGEHSEAMLDRRMLCFERRRQQLEAVVAVLETPDPRVVENAVQTLGVLEALERCSDLEALQSQVPLPADESAREAVADARTRLAQIDADNAAGRGAELGQQVDAVVEHAMVQAFPPLLAEAHHMRAVVLTAADQRQAAIDESVVAHRFATQAGDARLAWRSALLAASRIGDTATGTDDALRWLEVADGWAQRFALDTGDRGYALQIRANIFQQGDRLEDALLDLRRSLAMTHDEPDPRAKAGDMGNRHNGIAFLLYRLARHDEAREHAQLAIRLLEDAYGVGHPLVARALAVLSYIERGRGDNAASLEAIERSLAIRQQSPGPASASLASALRERADALKHVGRLDESIAEFEHALEVLGALEHPSPAEEVMTMGNLALALGQRGDKELALEYTARSLDLGIEIFGAHSARIAGMRLNYGSALAQAQRHDEAIEQTLAAVEVLEELFGPNHVHVGVGRLNLASSSAKLERFDDAWQQVSRAKEVFEEHFGPRHHWLARAANVESLVLLGQGRHTEALERRRWALGVLEQAFSMTNAEVIRTRYDVGTLLLQMGDPLHAIESLEGVVRVADEVGFNPDYRGDFRFSLARALWSQRSRRAEALLRADEAAQLFETADSERAAEVRAWSAAHR